MFVDVKGFTEIAERMPADELITQLDESFRGFDHLIGKYGMEKIKTIGDCYMCACGLPTEVANNAIIAIQAALDIQEFMSGFNTSKKIQDLPVFLIRIGIHTGPVVAGVVGITKFAYDIWGNTVNLASQMEHHSEPGKINISEYTYSLVKEIYECESRGKISTKSKEDIEMYFVTGKK